MAKGRQTQVDLSVVKCRKRTGRVSLPPWAVVPTSVHRLTSKYCHRSAVFAWQIVDPLSLRAFLGLDVTEATPNYSTFVTDTASDPYGNALGGGHVGAGTAVGSGSCAAASSTASAAPSRSATAGRRQPRTPTFEPRRQQPQRPVARS